MADNRELIIEEIRSRLETVLTSNTNPKTGAAYHYSIGENVTYGSMEEPNPTNCPGVNFADGSEDGDVQYGKDGRSMFVTFEAYTLDRDDEMIIVARKMLSDIEGVLLYDSIGGGLYDKKMKLDGKCYEIKFISKDPFQLAGDIPLAGLVCTFQVKFEA